MTTPIPTLAPAQDASIHDGFEILDAAHSHAILELGKLAELVTHLRTHGVDDAARASAAELAQFFDAYNRDHHADEEKHVFPRLMRDGDPETVQAIRCLLQDHRWLGEDWREIGALVHAVASGQGWVDIDTLQEGVQVYAGLMRAHISLEEAYIYPQARARVNERVRLEMGREIAARRRAEHHERVVQSGLDDAQLSVLQSKLLERERMLATLVRRANAGEASERGGEVHDRKEQAERSEVGALDEAIDRLEREELRNVQAALRRMQAGVYGLCIDCDQPILLSRLLAQPEGVRCTSCQVQNEAKRSKRRQAANKSPT